MAKKAGADITLRQSGPASLVNSTSELVLGVGVVSPAPQEEALIEIPY